MFTIIGLIFSGAITGELARAILPGTQNIGWGKTIGLGVAANLVVGLTVGLIFGTIITFLASIAAGVGLLSFAIQKGYLSSDGQVNLDPGGSQDRRLN